MQYFSDLAMQLDGGDSNSEISYVRLAKLQSKMISGILELQNKSADFCLLQKQ